jgi:hypothetical protein
LNSTKSKKVIKESNDPEIPDPKSVWKRLSTVEKK